jgi:HEAT repeat protein
VEIRVALIEELEKTLDSQRAGQILDALGLIADDESIQKLKGDLNDSRLETAWRVSAADALSIAANASPSQAPAIVRELSARLNDQGEDNRIRIGVAIALCKLRQTEGVTYLLDELSRFQQTVGEGSKLSASKLKDLTRLRIQAQEALTSSGSFVTAALLEKMSREQQVRRALDELEASRQSVEQGTVSPTLQRALSAIKVATTGLEKAPYDTLVARVKEQEPGPIIIWAASKTLGELKVADAVPYLGEYMKAKHKPVIALAEDGSLIVPAPAPGAVPIAVQLTNWETPDEAEVAAVEANIEEFVYPDYVRWTAAIALGKIGDSQAVALLKEADALETDFTNRLGKNKGLKGFYMRAPVINGLLRTHEDVLFYIHRALAAAQAQAQG